MAAGRAPARIRVGNLESRRDFMDVRDTVRAYPLLLEKQRPGGIYNLASGRAERIGGLLERLCDLAGVRPDIAADPALHRPTDATPRLDLGAIRTATGWTCDIPLATTLADIYRDALDAGLRKSLEPRKKPKS